MLSAEIIRELEETMQKLTSLQVIVCTFDTLSFSVCCTSLAQLLTICISYAFYIHAQLSRHLLAV